MQAAQQRNQEVARKSESAAKSAPAQPTGREATAAPAEGPTDDTIQQNKKIVQQWIQNWRDASPGDAAGAAAQTAQKAAQGAAKGAEEAAGKAAKAAAPSDNGSSGGKSLDKKEREKEIEARRGGAQEWIAQWRQGNGGARLAHSCALPARQPAQLSARQPSAVMQQMRPGYWSPHHLVGVAIVPHGNH